MGVLLLLSAVVLAQPVTDASPEGLGPDAPPAARQRYRVGVDLYVAGRYAEAAREFDVAASILPGSPKLAYNAARSWERAQELPKAIARYRRYLEIAPDAPDRAAIQRTILALEAGVPEAPARLLVDSTPTAASVFLDGATEAAGRTPASLELSAGLHTLRVEAPGYEPVGQTLDLPGGTTRRLTFTLATKQIEAPGWVRPTGWAAVGLAVVAAGASAWLAVSALSARDGAEGLRGEPDHHASLESDFEDARLGAFLAGGGALALAGAGAGLLAWSW